MSGDRVTAATRVPARSDYGSGCYRRCIVLRSEEAAEVVGELADDFHHFGVRLRHDGGRVTAIEGEDIRVPWTTCPGALAPLRRMEGVPLSRSLLDLHRHTPARQQCTHLHDLACLAIAHAARVARGAAPERRYDVTLPDRVEGKTCASLRRDAAIRLEWQLEGRTVVSSRPRDFDSLVLGSGAFYRALRRERDAELAEAAWILQRAVFIGLGRRHDFEAIHAAVHFAPVVGAACHTFDPARLGEAKRVYGSLRDFSATPERILDRDGTSSS